jgi:hypothetical protein
MIGQVDVANRAECTRAFEADRSLIDGSALLVVVLLYNDPGSLLEAGYAIGRGIPVVLWDPSGRFDNVWLWSLPTARATTLDEVIAATFRILGAGGA